MNSFRNLAKKSVRLRNLRDNTLLLLSYLDDWKRWRRQSGMADVKDQGLRANIVMDAHRLEKGLSLPAPRRWFGHEVVERLVDNTSRYASLKVDDEDFEFTMALSLGALDSYFASYLGDDVAAPSWVDPMLERVRKLRGRLEEARLNPDFLGGVHPIHDIPMEPRVSGEVFRRFVVSRHSIRHFSLKPVPRELVVDSIAVASLSPSVCNRRGARVRIYGRGPEADLVLSLQNGNRGFGDSASFVLLISYDIRWLVSPGERNQAYVDGGLFAMTLMYALHSVGLGTCPLNWSAPYSQDRRLRTAIGLPEHEVVIMMVALGYPSSNALVTNSPTPPSLVR